MTRPGVGTSPDMGMEAASERAPTAAPAGRCSAMRADVETHCADADLSAQASHDHQEVLRDARREYAGVTRDRDADALLRDRRHIGEQKTASQATYRAAILRAADKAAVQDAAAQWTRRIDQLNRHARIADQRADSLARRANELERIIPGLELAADAARITAEAAQVVCMEARRALAACEEESQHMIPAQEFAPPAQASTTAEMGEIESGPVPMGAAIHGLMRGDRQQMLGVALRLGEETGLEAARLQLLLLELGEQITARALEEYALAFPSGHPFWSQFTAEGARGVADSLSSMGFRFDGVGAWVDGHAPTIRDLAVALAYCGYDPRTLRRPASQTAIDNLWQGTAVLAEDYLFGWTPDLALPEIVELLGERAGRLGELWDIWGRLRPLLLRPA